MTILNRFRLVRPALIPVLALFLGGSLLGCASIDEARIEEARAVVTEAQSNSDIDPEGPHMREAVSRLSAAEEEKRFKEVSDHNAYLAGAHARVAIVRAEARRANLDKSIALRDALGEAAEAQDEAAAAKLAAERAKRAAMALASSVDAVMAEQTERGLVLTLGGVLFAFDSAELGDDARFALARVSGFLIALPGRQVLVEGFTDNIGTAEYNLELSKKRADSVSKLLTENGVESQRISPDGYGKAFPVADNATDEGRERNRRVEVVILEPGERAANRKRVAE